MLTRGLAHRPQDRYQTIEEWSAALEGALQGPRLPPTSWVPHGSPDASRRRGPRPRRVALLLTVLVSLVLGIGLGGAGVTVIRERGRPTVRTEPRDGGDERTVVEDHGITITLDGPTTVSVGDSVRFDARVSGAESWAWVGPDGMLIAATDQTGELELEPETAGRTTLRVLAVDERSHIVQASRQLHVTDDGEP